MPDKLERRAKGLKTHVSCCLPQSFTSLVVLAAFERFDNDSLSSVPRSVSICFGA